MTRSILGFDISSATTAWALLELDETTKDIKFVSAGYIKPIKKGTLIERLVDTRNKIRKIIADNKPDDIAIEDIVMFMQNRSTAKTITILTSFNRMIGLAAYDYLGKSPEMYSVLQIRHGIKIGKSFPKKEDIPALVSKHLGITFPYEHNKKGKIKVENYDRSDAIAVALFHAFLLSGRKKSKKK